ncbi:MAG: hypothetical protein R3C32_01635 [Chloroflexota bacterium]
MSFLVIVSAAQTVDHGGGRLRPVGRRPRGARDLVHGRDADHHHAGGRPQQPGVPLAVLVGLVVGLVCGIVNGVLVAYLGVMAFIATLGMSQVFTSLARYRVDSKPSTGWSRRLRGGRARPDAGRQQQESGSH